MVGHTKFVYPKTAHAVDKLLLSHLHSTGGSVVGCLSGSNSVAQVLLIMCTKLAGLSFIYCMDTPQGRYM